MVSLVGFHSTHMLMDGNWIYPSSNPSAEDDAINRLDISALRVSLDLLDVNERALINALFFDGLTEREYSTQTGIAQKTINDRKHRILKK